MVALVLCWAHAKADHLSKRKPLLPLTRERKAHPSLMGMSQSTYRYQHGRGTASRARLAHETPSWSTASVAHQRFFPGSFSFSIYSWAHVTTSTTCVRVQGAYPYVAKQILNEDKPEMVALMKATLINSEGNIAWRRLEQLVSV